jgi:hypothetical protein
MSPDGSYNGYANYQTWNVCLWISNDEMLNGLADQCNSYDHFKLLLRDVFETHPVRYETPDGVSWNDSGINMAEMVEYWEENFSKVPT